MSYVEAGYFVDGLMEGDSGSVDTSIADAIAIAGSGGGPGFWLKQFMQMYEQKPKKVEEAIQEAEPEELEVVIEAIPEVKQEIRREYGRIDYAKIAENVLMQQFIARQIIQAIQSRQLDEEEAEILLLMS